MQKLAIDIVIIPPEPVIDFILECNRSLLQTRADNIILGKTQNLPHISLAMGCLPEDHISQLVTLLQSVAASQAILELPISGIKSNRTATGDTVVSLDVGLIPELRRLHESIVAAVTPLLSGNATEGDLLDFPPITPATLEWINQYIPLHSYQHFWPHITLGFGTYPAVIKPFSFPATQLAIVHLGNHCTCKKVLRTLPLNAEK